MSMTHAERELLVFVARALTSPSVRLTSSARKGISDKLTKMLTEEVKDFAEPSRDNFGGFVRTLESSEDSLESFVPAVEVELHWKGDSVYLTQIFGEDASESAVIEIAPRRIRELIDILEHIEKTNGYV